MRAAPAEADAMRALIRSAADGAVDELGDALAGHARVLAEVARRTVTVEAAARLAGGGAALVVAARGCHGRVARAGAVAQGIRARSATANIVGAEGRRALRAGRVVGA